MATGILIYSYSGNTLAVAERIKAAIEVTTGEQAKIERIMAENAGPNSGNPIILKDIPRIDQYDRLIIGAPINAFSLCRAMTMYLSGHAEFSGKHVGCFITQHFKHSFLGGSNGLKQMVGLCEKAGGEVEQTAIIHWSSPKREAEIDDAAALMLKV